MGGRISDHEAIFGISGDETSDFQVEDKSGNLDILMVRNDGGVAVDIANPHEYGIVGFGHVERLERHVSSCAVHLVAFGRAGPIGCR